VTDQPSQAHPADLAWSRPVHHPVPLAAAGTLLTATLLRQRMSAIRDMCTAGQPLYVIVTELRYLADELDRVDKSTWPAR
jgi:hypothetical protein